MKELYLKKIRNEISEINNFLKDEDLIIIHQDTFPINDCKINLTKSPENKFIEYEVQLKSRLFPDKITFAKLGFDNEFIIQSDNTKFIVPSKSATKIEGKSLASSEKISGEISSIYSECFPINSNSYFRSIIKITKSNLTTNFLGSKYTCEKTHYALGLIKLKIVDLEYHVYRHEKEGVSYLVIECLNKDSFSNFRNTSEVILKSLGLLTGFWCQNEQFIFEYNSVSFENFNSFFFEVLDNSLITNHELINPREFRSFLRVNSDNNAKLTPQLFPEETLSQLITKLKSYPEIERTVDLLIKGNGNDSPIIKCSIFHVALETIVGLIHKQNKEFFEPIKNTENLESLKMKFQTLLENKRALFNDLDYDVLLKKIEYLNTPFNKDIFLLAFELYDIQLPEWLKKMLSTRNKFLHGKTPFNENNIKTKTKELNLYADRIHLLTSILLLKYSGYTGHIKNHAAYRLRMEEHYSEKEFVEDLGQNDDVYYSI